MHKCLCLIGVLITASTILLAFGSWVLAGECKIADLVTNGIFTRGSMICTDGKWLDRRASLLVAAAAKNCRSMGEKGIYHYVKRGALDFDRKVKELGKDAACKMLDDNMKIIEEGVQ